MNQKTVQLNLARKWRSKQFDAVIGQDLAVRILQNSLYANQFFPVYLFSGQRGCGKTTSARLFAAAINCEQLELFQKNPREHKIPCLTCPSCSAMARHSHPDFIEIDAASYTGVDNVRDIIESAALLPVLGRRKMYLIDEAHMLSKAAFNAFLKILEEPPASVIFMLATTDPHKILETVRSRCFQLFFSSIPTPVMAQHLAHLCKEEGIAADDAALQVIAAETEGSARDAINLLEQVRFSHQRVSVEAVLKLLGHVPEQHLIDLFEYVIAGDIKRVMELLTTPSFETSVPVAVWQKSTELVRNLVFLKQGLKDTGMFEQVQQLSTLAQRLSLPHLIMYLKILSSYELQLLRSTMQRTVVEMLFIELSQVTGPAVGSLAEKQAASAAIKTPQLQEQSISSTPAALATPTDERWQAFMAQVAQLSDPMLQSIFKQGQFGAYDQSTAQVTVLFEREAHFFTEWLQETKSTWSGLLEAVFGQGAALKPVFSGVKQEAKASSPSGRPLPQPAQQRQSEKKGASETEGARSTTKPAYSRTAANPAAQELKKEIAIDISDDQKWQKAHQLKELFGGSIVAIQEDENHDETGQ